jgi:hypothetical protein
VSPYIWAESGCWYSSDVSLPGQTEGWNARGKLGKYIAGLEPDAVTRGDVGLLWSYLKGLREIDDAVFREGKYAKEGK